MLNERMVARPCVVGGRRSIGSGQREQSRRLTRGCQPVEMEPAPPEAHRLSRPCSSVVDQGNQLIGVGPVPEVMRADDTARDPEPRETLQVHNGSREDFGPRVALSRGTPLVVAPNDA